MAEQNDELARLEDLFDRHGGDFDAWPDRRIAGWARETALRSPEARLALEQARHLDGLLAAREAGFADDAALIERTVAAVTRNVPPRRGELRVWLPRLAASFLLAAVLGGAVTQTLAPGSRSEAPEYAMLDSLLYGPAEGELR